MNRSANTQHYRAFVALVIVVCLACHGIAASESTPGQRWFEAESINPGLGPRPTGLNMDTPRETVSTFLELGDRGEFDTAAHLLDLNRLDEGDQADYGPELARKLRDIIDRTMIIRWAELSDRPDALLESRTDDSPMAGQPRRSLNLQLLELERQPGEIRLNRIKTPDAEPVWLFSAQTVRDIEAMYELYGPGWLEGKLPDALQRPAAFGTRIWEWMALPLVVLLLALAGWLTHGLLGWLGKRLPLAWVNRAADRMRTPLAIALMAMLGQFVTGWLITFSGVFHAVLMPLLLAMTILGLTFAALRGIDATLELVTERFVDDIDDSKDSDRRELYTSIYALRRFVLLVAVLISAVLIIVQLRLFDDVGLSLLASAGVATVILGIAGRTVLGNILASLQIAVAKPVRIGDAIRYEGYWGHVESIFYTFVILRTWDGLRLVVPVQHFISQPFENWSMVDASVTRTFTMRLDHSAEPERLREVFEQLVTEDDKAVRDDMMMTVVSDHTEHYQELTFFATAANPSDAWMLHMRLREGLGHWIRKHHPEWWPTERLLMRRREQIAGETLPDRPTK
jgi:small-conductance mechanosensitive channel